MIKSLRSVVDMLPHLKMFTCLCRLAVISWEISRGGLTLQRDLNKFQQYDWKQALKPKFCLLMREICFWCLLYLYGEKRSLWMLIMLLRYDFTRVKEKSYVAEMLWILFQRRTDWTDRLVLIVWFFEPVPFPLRPSPERLAATSHGSGEPWV